MKQATNKQLISLYDYIELGTVGYEYELMDGSYLEEIEVCGLSGFVHRSRDGEIWETLTCDEAEKWISLDSADRIALTESRQFIVAK